MLTFLEANGRSPRVRPQDLALWMIDLQKRSEAGESASQLITEIACLLVRHRKSKVRRR
jgi:hypothetical protein